MAALSNDYLFQVVGSSSLCDISATNWLVLGWYFWCPAYGGVMTVLPIACAFEASRCFLSLPLTCVPEKVCGDARSVPNLTPDAETVYIVFLELLACTTEVFDCLMTVLRMEPPPGATPCIMHCCSAGR